MCVCGVCVWGICVCGVCVCVLYMCVWVVYVCVEGGGLGEQYGGLEGRYSISTVICFSGASALILSSTCNKKGQKKILEKTLNKKITKVKK